jgi:phenylpyruvate tautomerase PptA (4-oxalocrotonate tautomerase family)
MRHLSISAVVDEVLAKHYGVSVKELDQKRREAANGE